MTRVLTVGHSTQTSLELVALLKAHGSRQVADVRTIPKSRRHPHFAREALEELLQREGIAYRHFPLLGGLRRPRKDSPNTAWQNESFRGYADHMLTDDFKVGLEELLAFAALDLTTVMCAEALWWRCHRKLLADALVVRGIEVRHIAGLSVAPLHTLTEFARVDGHTLLYPGLL